MWLLNAFCLVLLFNVWINRSVDICLLTHDDFIIDYRGIIFEDVPDIIDCTQRNVESNNVFNQTIDINLGDIWCDISAMLCTNITTNGDILYSPKVSLSNGKLFGQPRINNGNNLLVKIDFKTQNTMIINPIFNVNNKITLKPIFTSYKTFIGVPILSAKSDISIEPTVIGKKSVIIFGIINTMGPITFAPNIQSNGPVILYADVINSSNITFNTVINSPNNDVFLITSLNTFGTVISNTQINNGQNGKVIPLSIDNSIFLANNFLLYTKESYNSFIFKAKITILKIIEKHNNKLLRILFSFNILNDEIYNVDINSNYLDIYTNKLMLGTIDEYNNQFLIFLKKD